MARKPRVQYPGAIYHLMYRGGWRELVMTVDWIAQRLEMGCRHTVDNCLNDNHFYNSRD
jgi:hypothetical protein